MNYKMLAVGTALIGALLAFLYWPQTPPTPEEIEEKAQSIIIPEFSQVALGGEIAFNENCAACHGQNAAGTDSGPSFLIATYRPGHHGDNAFAIAPRQGVRAHHWGFGNMPVIEGVSDAQIRWITRYVRELQVANGVQ